MTLAPVDKAAAPTEAEGAELADRFEPASARVLLGAAGRSEVAAWGFVGGGVGQLAGPY